MTRKELIEALERSVEVQYFMRFILDENGLARTEVGTIYDGYFIVFDERNQYGISFNKKVDKRVFDICVEYARTPIKDRVEQKKYRVQLPDEDNLSDDRVYVLAKITEGTVMINRPKLEVFKESQRYMLTEDEIKKNHSYLWQFAEEVKG